MIFQEHGSQRIAEKYVRKGLPKLCMGVEETLEGVGKGSLCHEILKWKGKSCI